MKSIPNISQFGALQGILLAIYFLLKSRKKTAILWFGLYVFIFSVGLLENSLTHYSDRAVWKIVLAIISNSSYLYGPFLYLFIFYITNDVNDFSGKQYFHFLPFFTFFTIQLYSILFTTKLNQKQSDIIEVIEFELLVIQILIYNILAIRMLKRHYQSILQTYSSIEEKDLNWLRLLLKIITGIYIFSFLLSHLMLFGVGEVKSLFVVVQISITLCIYFMSYIILLHPNIFTASSVTPKKTEEAIIIESRAEEAYIKVNVSESVISSKYKKSGLKLQQAQNYHLQLKDFMHLEKPYRNPDLNISVLATQLGISKNHLTQVLNEQQKMNFFEFINCYRTEEAKKLLLNPKYSHLTIEGIAKECGFKSRTTFFVNFKKTTGLSPQEWIKNAKTGKA